MNFKTMLAFAVASATVALAAPTETVVSYAPFVKDASGKVTIPGAANGLYTGFNETHFAYHGIATPSSEVSKRVPAMHELNARQSTCNVVCQGVFGSASDIDSADTGLEIVFNNNPNFHGMITYVVNSAYAFGCDYGNGQSMSGSAFASDVGCINAQCGSNQAGWNQHKTWKSTYGRELGGASC